MVFIESSRLCVCGLIYLLLNLFWSSHLHSWKCHCAYGTVTFQPSRLQFTYIRCTHAHALRTRWKSPLRAGNVDDLLGDPDLRRRPPDAPKGAFRRRDQPPQGPAQPTNAWGGVGGGVGGRSLRARRQRLAAPVGAAFHLNGRGAVNRSRSEIGLDVYFAGSKQLV